MRMNRSVGVVLVIAASAAAGIGAAVKAAEDHTTTFTFNFVNAKLTNVPSATTTVTGPKLTGSTNVPNVGPVDLVGTFVQTGGAHGAGTLTVRNKKADKIFFTWHNGEIDSSREFECTMTITGGTGTYENAEGTGLVEGTVSPISQGGTAKVSFLAQGVISF
jgi:hypothetical protein